MAEKIINKFNAWQKYETAVESDLLENLNKIFAEGAPGETAAFTALKPESASLTLMMINHKNDLGRDQQTCLGFALSYEFKDCIYIAQMGKFAADNLTNASKNNSEPESEPEHLENNLLEVKQFAKEFFAQAPACANQKPIIIAGRKLNKAINTYKECGFVEIDNRNNLNNSKYEALIAVLKLSTEVYAFLELTKSDKSEKSEKLANN